MEGVVQALCEDTGGPRESRQSLDERQERLAGCLVWYRSKVESMGQGEVRCLRRQLDRLTVLLHALNFTLAEV